ncbi:MULTISPECIES: 1,4-alpha-glucan branching protein GlgB [unclassified Isoptericola]|uniref:1,4-alpha-glucan branching protein GlgB n=1 Tax=unclassified Isoptericola TaxID=2623355 RepID=UPI00271295D1|nr:MULTISPECIES: 1,4-alpha-glucan branching protein GlgB [unclassified Isoptericola]MDO8143005.1 1,4-alpha-glucan branching protein GlgB [Isoptericola sp. 178]MDO8150819.1 1,4-alpha-glucan branching protein GlgB [Isoptericola sp. b408]
MTPVPAAVDPELLTAVARGTTHDPHSVLGAHLLPAEAGGAPAAVVRVLRPLADEVVVLTVGPDGEEEHPATHEAGGVWSAVVPAPTDDDGTRHAPDYRVRTRYADDVHTADDPYRFLPSLGEVDLHLVGEGRHEELWKVLGANRHVYPSARGDVVGTSFAVWAPNARGVRLVGDHNRWTGIHPMRSLGSSGVWEIFVPDVGPGTRYKYEICGPDGIWRAKADPLAKGTEVPPATASVVVHSDHTWQDDAWMEQRASRDQHGGPISVYEVHLGSWRPGLGYRELAEQLTDYVVEQGFTHVELMPVAEHPFGGSWGYQVTSYYAPTSRFGSPDDFRYLVDRLHQAGVGVILDWVPAHFPRDEFALARFDGTPLYEHADPRRGEQPDWGTYVFDFGRREVRNFLVANATYWFEEFHADGLRVDAVASMLYLDYSRNEGEWTPNVHGGRENLEAISFLQEANATAYRRSPGVLMIAEESTAFPGVTRPTDAGGLGFGLKWNMGWMNDTLQYVSKDPMYRSHHHGELTFSLVYAFSEQYVLPISHDEVVHGKGSLLRKMPGDRWQQLAGVRSFLAYQWTHPGKQLLFMGCEFAQEAEWSEGAGLDWWSLEDAGNAGVQHLVRDLNGLYRATPALWERDFDGSGFEWIEGGDAARNLVAYVRRAADGSPVVVVVNFAGVPHEDYRLGLPHGGAWSEALNTDAPRYGGSGVVNEGDVVAEDVPWQGREHSATVRVPPLGALVLTPR